MVPEVEDTATFCLECGGRLGVPSAPLRKKKHESKWMGGFLIIMGIGLVVSSAYGAMLGSYMGEPPSLEEIFSLVVGIVVIVSGFVKTSKSAG